MIGVVVTYYGEHQLPQALASIANQSIHPDAVVIVNDAHPESARDIVKEYGYAYIENKSNVGLAESRNVGIDHLPSEFYIPLDADDRLAPRCIETYLNRITLHNRYYYSDMYLVQSGGKSLWKSKPFDITSLLRYNCISATSCVPKEAWHIAGGYDSEFSHYGGWEDWAMWLKLYQHGIIGVHVPQPLFYRTIRHDSMTKKLDKGVLKQLLRDKFPDLYGDMNA